MPLVGNVLRSEFVSHDPFALVMRAGQNMIRIVKMQDFMPLQSTVLGWEVGDVEAAVEWLVRRGVVLEKYPWVQDQHIPVGILEPCHLVPSRRRPYSAFLVGKPASLARKIHELPAALWEGVKSAFGRSVVAPGREDGLAEDALVGF
jgi:hypothetical protein